MKMSDLLLELTAKDGKKLGALLNPAEVAAKNASRMNARQRQLDAMSKRRLTDIQKDHVTFDAKTVKQRNALRADIQRELDYTKSQISAAERSRLKDAFSSGKVENVKNWIKENPKYAAAIGLGTVDAALLGVLAKTWNDGPEIKPAEVPVAPAATEPKAVAPAATEPKAVAPAVAKPETLTDTDVAPKRSTMSGKNPQLQPDAEPTAVTKKADAAPAAVPASKKADAAPAAVPASKKADAAPAAAPAAAEPKATAKDTQGYKNNTLGVGVSSKRVGQLQDMLNTLGYTDDQGKALTVDNDFGPRTKQAVMKLQQALKDKGANIEVDGKWGEQSLKAVSTAGGTPSAVPASASTANLGDNSFATDDTFRQQNIDRMVNLATRASNTETNSPNGLTRSLSTNGTDQGDTTKGTPGTIVQDIVIPDADPSKYVPPIDVEPSEEAKKAWADSYKTKESIDILKLAGLKPITERDFTQGIIKVKPLQTLTESTELNECGAMGVTTPTNASLSISASASSGEEVASMLQSIMTLAGLKPVTQDMMPMSADPMPMVKALDIIGNSEMGGMEEPTSFEVDSDGNGESDIEVDVVDADSLNVGGEEQEEPSEDDSEEQKAQEGFQDATTQPNPQMMAGKAYGSIEDNTNKKRNFKYTPPGSGSNPLMKPRTMGESIDQTTADLFKAYEAFKNGQ